MEATDRTTLGRTGVSVTRIGLGTACLGGWPDAVDPATAHATVRRAWAAGLRYFDTAPFYGHGNSELHLGHELAGRDRPDFTLSTKVGRRLLPEPPPDPFYAGARPVTPVFDFSALAIRESLAGSRERLGFDRIEVALIHDPDDHQAEALASSYPVLAELRAAGEIGAIGVGTTRIEPLRRFAEEGDFDCFLLAGRYTLLEQDSLELLTVMAERGISLIAGGVYNSGLLVDPRPGATFDYAPAPDELVARAVRLRDTCAEYGVPLRAAALQFPLAHPVVASVVMGATSPAEVDDNLAMFALPLPAELWTTLKERELLAPDTPTPG